MKTCRWCNSSKVVSDICLRDNVGGSPGEGGSLTSRCDITLVTWADPGAILFKEEVTSTLRASVCGDCGHVEFFATDPAALHAAVEKAEARAAAKARR
jgi:hypothetical protein